MWWFEIVDMVHKIFLTALLPFFQPGIQIPAGMFAVCSFTILILLGRPYERPPDDMLHLLAQADLFLFLLGGLLFSQGLTYDAVSDVIMSAFLIIITIGFIFVFLRQLFFVMRKVIRTFVKDQKKYWNKGADHRVEPEPFDDLQTPHHKKSTETPNLTTLGPISSIPEDTEDNPQLTTSNASSSVTQSTGSKFPDHRTTVTSENSSTVDRSQKSDDLTLSSYHTNPTTGTGTSTRQNSTVHPHDHSSTSSYAPPPPPPVHILSEDQLAGLTADADYYVH